MNIHIRSKLPDFQDDKTLRSRFRRCMLDTFQTTDHPWLAYIDREKLSTFKKDFGVSISLPCLLDD